MVCSLVLLVVSSIRPITFEKPRIIIADSFEPILSFVSLPFQRGSLLLHDVMRFAQLQADNARLEKENEELREWYQTALLLESENKSLKELLNLKVDPEYEHITARVMADSGNAYAKSILVSRESKEHVNKGAAVLSGVGLIGRVIDVGEKTFRILLVTDINSRVPVVVEDTGQHAIMAGGNEITPRLAHFPEDSEIKRGARLITSGYGGVYPHGLPVGRVVETPDGQLNVMLFANFNTLQIVRVLQKKPG